MVSRRRFLLTAAAGALGWSGLVRPQAVPREFRIAYLRAGPRTPDGALPEALRNALAERGYVAGRNASFVTRFADGDTRRLPALAEEIVRMNVDVIVTQGGLATLAAKQATSVIPIVMAPATGDAVATDLIASMPRPGGNVTGLTDETVLLSEKRMQLLAEIVPNARSIAVIWNASDEGMTGRYRGVMSAARMLQIDVQAIAVREPQDFPGALATLASRKPDALFLVSDVLTTSNRAPLIEFVAAQRIPAMYEYSYYVRDGGLIAYGPSPEEGFRQAAAFVDRILKGAKPAELPAEHPSRYYLSLNRKTAAALGMTLPQSLLLRADEIVQ